MTKLYASYATRMTCVSDPRRTLSASSHLSLSSSIHSLWSESFATELPFLLFLLGTHTASALFREVMMMTMMKKVSVVVGIPIA